MMGLLNILVPEGPPRQRGVAIGPRCREESGGRSNMQYSLRQPATDNPMGTKGSSIFSNKEWDELLGDLNLSSRALELIRGIFDDQTEEGIAYDLRISVHTVHSYIIRVYQRFGVSSREQLLVYIFGQYLERHRSPESKRSAGQRKRAPKRRVRF